MISAYIMPHPPIARSEIGKGEERKIQSTVDAFRKASEMIKNDSPETLIIVSPHSIVYSDAFYIAGGQSWHGDLRDFGAPNVSVDFENDTELAEEIIRLCNEKNIPAVYTQQGICRADHGSTVPLSFIKEAGCSFKLLRISPAFLPNETLFEMGKLIERAAAHIGRKITFLASGDLSHRLKKDGPYGFKEEGVMFDKKVTECMKSCDFKGFENFDADFLECAAQCGLYGFIMMSGALNDYNVSSEFLSYEGPFGVGYAICAFNCENKYTLLARKSLEKYVRTGSRLKLSDVDKKELTDEMLNSRNGTFVSLKIAGQLRGCIGTISPFKSCVADEIITMAVEAGTKDPRFMPVSASELELLEYDVDVLSKPESAGLKDLDAKRYGVIVSSFGKRGLLLPDLEGVDTPKQQIEIARKKAGISDFESVSLERFTVERHM